MNGEIRKEDLQVENGNYTRIVNPLIESLIKIPFKGCELAVALYIIRKTYGYQKKQDSISLSQFQLDLERSRQTVVTALKNLQLVNVVRLVKRGDMKGACNIWEINKYVNTWKLVKTARLVQRNDKPSLTERLNLVKTARHTKENTKETKETVEASSTASPFNFKDYLQVMIKDKNVHVRLIAVYFHKKGSSFDSLAEVSESIARHSKSAVKVSKFGKQKIFKAMEECVEEEKKRPIGWTLETVFKKLTK